ncbi:hypothetical protein [Pedobacter frigoris]|uniref:hypothetical protein n=1 Tax=Pedobacter frigoris TaxID=2571272 RepID=UPI00292CEA90|nr:hypothetical protein [Pedobacter frigoris]
MFDLKTFKQKSPQQRFLLILGLVMFAFYLVLGVTLIAWKDMPVTLERNYRIALGVLLIVYAAIRFARVTKQKAD